MRRVALIAAALGAACAGGARAQLPADASWQTLETRNFRVTFHEGLEPLARHAAASAERAHAALTVLVAGAPRGTIDVVVSDNVDFTNGYATPFPSNRIVVYAKPPVDVLELQFVHDWIDLVVIHELAHIFHLDVTSGFGRAIRAVFGRLPMPWPAFPAVLSPAWTIEGLATGIESAATGFGRVHGSYHEMVVRTAALQDRMDDLERLASASPTWPGQARIYIYGSLFMDYLARRFGPDATARVVRATAGALLPPPVGFDRVARRALGVSFREAYDDWRAEVQADADAAAAALRAQGLTGSEALTAGGGYALHPRFAPDGRSIAFASSDGRERPRLRVIDSATGAVIRSHRSNGTAGLSWLGGGRILTSDLEFTDQFRVFSDLYVHGEDASRRLTRGARLQDPDVDPGGTRAIAVENGGGTNRLVLVDLATGARRPLSAMDPDVHWALPRFSPDGRCIAAGRWRTGGAYDVVLLDSEGRVLLDVTDGTGISAGPAWSHDGGWLLFWSDRTGIPNIYAAAMSGCERRGPLRQVTSVLTGAYHPDVSPDGRWIVFAAYHHDGFRIERMPFDPASWREPQPAGVHASRGEAGTHAAHAGSTATGEERGAFQAAAAAAAAAADTSAGAARPYRALRHARPYAWAPLLEPGSVAGDDSWFLGLGLFGRDLVDRHRWTADVLVHPATGRTTGSVGYTFRGLPTSTLLGLHPDVGVRVSRDWDEIARDVATQRFIDQREDVAAASIALIRQRMRRAAGIGAAAEVVRRARSLQGPGWAPEARLRDPHDDLVGLRGSAFLTTAAMPRLAISRENGATFQLAARQRWDRTPLDVEVDGQPLRLDGGYRELTTWNAAYLALPLQGFSRHVVAARASGLHRQGPGATASSIGGPSTQPVLLPAFAQEFGGASRLLPVRGFESGARNGTRAWTASAEYRAPLAIVNGSLRPLPLFIDRLAAAAFLDAGHAWCAPREQALLPCSSARATDQPLIGTGMELTAFTSFYGVPLPLRAGIAAPLQGGTGARLYLLAGATW